MVEYKYLKKISLSDIITINLKYDLVYNVLESFALFARQMYP